MHRRRETNCGAAHLVRPAIHLLPQAVLGAALILVARNGIAQVTLDEKPASSPKQVQKEISCTETLEGDSHVRIVQLSNVIGAVKMDRGRGRGAELVIQNSPIASGVKIGTPQG